MANLVETRSDVEYLISRKRAAFVWGRPGIGKSEIIRDLADFLGFNLIDIRLSYFDAVDLRGLPVADLVNMVTNWLRPQIWPALNASRPSLIFFDEMDRGAVSVANAALQIVLEYRIGEHVLPPETRIVAAGNGSTDKRGTNKISGAHANRFTHLFVEADHEVTADHFDAKGHDPIMSAWLRTNGEKYLCTDPDGSDNPAFASPRAWETVVDFIPCAPGERLRRTVGTVGKDAGLQFEAFVQTFQSLPPLAEILANPKGAPLPDTAGKMWMVSSALARKATHKNFDDIVTYCDRLPVEHLNKMISMATKRDESLKMTRAYINSSIANQDIKL